MEQIFQKFDNHRRNLPFLFLTPLYRDSVPKNGCNSRTGRGKSIGTLSAPMLFPSFALFQVVLPLFFRLPLLAGDFFAFLFVLFPLQLQCLL